FGTLEFRVCDVPTSPRVTVALAALAQAVVVKLYRLRRSNLGFRKYSRALVEENKWRAARYGLDGRLIDFGQRREVPMRELAVEYYRAFLKHAVLEGTYVINNPFWWTADDKFFNYAVAQRVGVAVPKTVVLPQKSYPAGIDLTSDSLRNLGFPIDWDGLLDYV